jgi:copper(I)-binding protein
MSGAGTPTEVKRRQLSKLTGEHPALASDPSCPYDHIRNLSTSPDELVAVRSLLATRVVLTQRVLPGGPSSVVRGLVIPGGKTLSLSPFGNDVVLQDPAPYEASKEVPLTLVFRDAGPVTIEASVTGPGTP